MLKAKPPAEADIKTDVQALKGCVAYHGPARTVQEMDSDIALTAAQEVFARLAPTDTLLSEELIHERREEANREQDD